MTDNISYYCGKPITEMTREELIDALTETCSMIENERKTHKRVLGYWRSSIGPRQIDTPL